MEKKVLKFEAPWCGQCKAMDNILSKATFPIEYIDVDKDENESLVNEYKVRGLPTIVILRDGEEVNRFSGVVTLEEVTKAYNAI